MRFSDGNISSAVRQATFEMSVGYPLASLVIYSHLYQGDPDVILFTKVGTCEYERHVIASFYFFLLFFLSSDQPVLSAATSLYANQGSSLTSVHLFETVLILDLIMI